MASRYITVSFLATEKPRMSCKKFIERRIIRAWKSVSQMTRKNQRASILPEDFVILTAKRRSIRFA
ncbi:hypothetical protein A0H81_06171, partial [Grifola frondosa]